MNFFVDFVIETHVAVVVNFNLYSFQMDWNSFWVTFSHISFELIFNENCCMQIFACVVYSVEINYYSNLLGHWHSSQSSYSHKNISIWQHIFFSDFLKRKTAVQTTNLLHFACKNYTVSCGITGQKQYR